MVQTFVQTTDDVVKFLKDQHNLIKDMFDEVLSASDPKAREKAFIELPTTATGWPRRCRSWRRSPPRVRTQVSSRPR
jgi:hypothetical protein